MVRGVVRAWFRTHGFVNLEGGKDCYVSVDDIVGGAALRRGGEVFIGRIKESDGHGGKVQGEQVSGPAVYSKEQYDQEMKEYRKSQEYKQKMKEKHSLGQAKVQKDGISSLSVGEKQRLVARLQREIAGQGQSGGEVRLPDPTTPDSAATYTRGEFEAFHGAAEGARLWALAGGQDKKKRRPRQKPGAKGDGPPTPVPDPTGATIAAAAGVRPDGRRRRDPTDPSNTATYTLQEFTEFHGEQEGKRLWALAAGSGGRGGGRGAR
eukprot:TRINITY_DN71331_c0_g1_i1.p3 TRINITY_DN71331_c0_g1~~TRINITY_DN71331_c0_g1_i1.p3  ORF type:complete len:291 (+),score=104.02 TRINITY_DN71331_c0_g1_i1:82-873(+)